MDPGRNIVTPRLSRKNINIGFLSAINEKSVSRIGIIRNGRELEET